MVRAVRSPPGRPLPTSLRAGASMTADASQTTEPFQIDPRLAADGPVLLDLPLCQVRLVDDARFFWVVLIPRKAGLVEIIDLDAADRGRLMEEIAAMNAAIKTASGCAKLNVAALGNMVSQLHVHIVARDPGDAAWPGPVFGVGTRVPLGEEALAARAAQIRASLGATGAGS